RRHGPQLHGLVDEYVRRYHPQDPYRPPLLPSPIRSVDVRAVSARQLRDAAYRERLFTRPGISSKLSILVRERDFALSISLYKDEDHGVFSHDEACWLGQSRALIAAAVQRHYSLVSGRRSDDVASFAEAFLNLKIDKPLSTREAAVCARIVKGCSNEAIALDLGISFHSVATYRRRAYSKLGVTSQNEVFRLLLQQREVMFATDARTAG
ncbi:MAG: helix-turn-helix transcriptional regulator, partial [Bauldia litoralis]